MGVPPRSPCHAFDEEFRLIGRSALGRRVLEVFVPRFYAGQVDIVEFDSSAPAPAELEAGRGGAPGRPAGGFLWAKGRATLWIEKGVSVEIRAALLFHEMVHAVDDQYLASFEESAQRWNVFRARAEEHMRLAARRRGLREEEVTGGDLLPAGRLELIRLRRLAENYDQLRLFRAERRAYTLLYRWVEEVCTVVPDYRSRLQQARKAGYVLDRPVSDEEIRQGYGLALLPTQGQVA